MSDKRVEARADALRIDRWLWAARFFKTRQLAATAIKSGKVTVNGERAKPARRVRVGDRLQIRREGLCYDVRVDALAERRVSAPAACALYTESDASREQRETRSAQLRIASESMSPGAGRPTKRDRRTLDKFRRAV